MSQQKQPDQDQPEKDQLEKGHTAAQDAPKAIYLADYQAPGYTTKQTELHFDIRDGQTTVTATLQVARQDAAASQIELLGEELPWFLWRWMDVNCPATNTNSPNVR